MIQIVKYFTCAKMQKEQNFSSTLATVLFFAEIFRSCNHIWTFLSNSPSTIGNAKETRSVGNE